MVGMRMMMILLVPLALGGCSGEMIANYVIDRIPLWGWIIIFGVPAGAVLYFCYPVIIPIWRALPGPVKAVLITIVVGLFSYLGGRWKGNKNAQEMEARRNAEALRKRTEVDREVDKMSPTERQNNLRDRWTRRDE